MPCQKYRFYCVSIIPTREGVGHIGVFCCFLDCHVVSIIPARGGWVFFCFIDIGLFQLFQSSHPARAGSSFRRCLAAVFLFQSSQPARVGSISMPILGCYCQVSIIPPARVGSLAAKGLRLLGGFNHPNPRGLGQRDGKPPWCIKVFQSSQPARVGSLSDLIGVGLALEFQSSQPVRAGF